MKKFLKIFGSIVLAAALVAGGYYVGSRAGENSIASALPHMTATHDAPSMKPDATGEPTEPEDKAEPEKEKDKEQAPPEKKEEETTEPEKTGRTVVKTEDTAVEDSSWSTLDKYSCDLLGNGDNAQVALYTSAETEDGEIIWDDGQKWVVEISDGDGGYYTLLDKYISNGNVYIEVDELDDGSMAVTVFTKTGAGFDVKQYTYGDNGFVEKTLYNSGSVNTMYSSIPDYE